ncbi:purine and uridine phosphorylase [Periconia macrospinosa]|uniref:Purine and uridine phosphorylase n=1 Tax=Periconia macrospinosa TaxID=97972 RepID=A0A2V1DQB2_9PLEO|nr:purine and uridine phosphorylase [Periconia macrospinosa]
MPSLPQLNREDYTVGWICALSIELAAAKALLDEKHENPIGDFGDDKNVYCTGAMAGHNVVIVCLPAGRIGNNPAAAVATQMQAAFKGIRIGLMVGIGGGVPTTRDIRLGDVVVSEPYQTFGGVVQYDKGKDTMGGFKRTGSLNSPPQILLSAVQTVKADMAISQSHLLDHILKLERFPTFQRQKAGPDVLFKATYNHIGTSSCKGCSPDERIQRDQRQNGEEVQIHYGTIASGNKVMKSATKRDEESKRLGDILCFEMEAAGLMDTFPCLVIRGISDYADSHKNKGWQPYAAGTAAAYAKEVLSVILPAQMKITRPVGETMRNGDS